jgi:hypothetical protein
MLEAVRRRLSYANVTATLALFVALGGVSYAAVKLPRNSVGGAQLKRDAVTSVKVKGGAIGPSDLSTSVRAQLAKAGAAGPQGPPGVKGDPGATGPTEAAIGGGAGSGFTPSAIPDVLSSKSRTVVTTRAGRLMVFARTHKVGVICSGARHLGLYLDGTPVPGSGETDPELSERGSITLFGLTDGTIQPGAHEVRFGFDCPADDFPLAYQEEITAGVVVLGG